MFSSTHWYITVNADLGNYHSEQEKYDLDLPTLQAVYKDILIHVRSISMPFKLDAQLLHSTVLQYALCNHITTAPISQIFLQAELPLYSMLRQHYSVLEESVILTALELYEYSLLTQRPGELLTALLHIGRRSQSLICIWLMHLHTSGRNITLVDRRSPYSRILACLRSRKHNVPGVKLSVFFGENLTWTGRKWINQRENNHFNNGTDFRGCRNVDIATYSTPQSASALSSLKRVFLDTNVHLNLPLEQLVFQKLGYSPLIVFEVLSVLLAIEKEIKNFSWPRSKSHQNLPRSTSYIDD